jgi:hypothetical protein
VLAGTGAGNALRPAAVMALVYFVISHRDNAKDSRFIGMIPHANILGVVSNVR